MVKGQSAKGKYGSVKTKIDGITFASKKEADYYCNLKLLLSAGEILGFARQPRFPIAASREYVADFIVWYADGSTEIIDVKGYLNQVCALKLDCFKERYPNLKVELK